MTQHPTPVNRWTTLDKDLKRIVLLEQATAFVGRPLVGLGGALAFVVVTGAIAAMAAGGPPTAS